VVIRECHGARASVRRHCPPRRDPPGRRARLSRRQRVPIALAAPALAGTADEQLSVAADKLEVAKGDGGAGFTFTVVSRSTVHQRDGGPLIELPDPDDPGAKPDLVSEVYVGGSLADGLVTPDGYFLRARSR